ncbi:unnamed protein product [Cylindrotheca closterium]|uniref:Uncharacterized protein n=1 Tax=Cylindrotheca closterium TaxID=2856 RepID=A0AAD2JMT9_9STRA|nr:unnamed protein product [Cylindrotheca closterium]
MKKSTILYIAALWSSLLLASDAFAPSVPSSSPSIIVNTRLQMEASSPDRESRRKELLSRNGPYFKLNRFQGAVEFGSSAKLVTVLNTQSSGSNGQDNKKENLEQISEWLSDGRGLAVSIWDESLMTELNNNLYRLQTMKLQFVTIQLAPSVDMKMWTQKDGGNNNMPTFSLQSVGFDPNIQLLPGVGISASSLGIQIDVDGELKPTLDGKGVEGKISFATQGILPPPMRMLPEPALKMASDSINETIVKFAIRSFEQGARKKYQEFLETTAKQKQEQQ